MTNTEAIKEIRSKVCNQSPKQTICTDSCMKGVGECPFSLAIRALDLVPDITTKTKVTEAQ